MFFFYKRILTPILYYYSN